MPPPHINVATKPVEKPWPIPILNLRVDDLAHPGASIFFKEVDPSTALRDAVLASFTWLYTKESVPSSVESILLVLRPMDGVAHTFGSVTHKEIHLSLDHIRNSAHRARDEILGVLVHEVVHCFQYNGLGKCPGGLIEGIADYVRLRAGFVPPHWKPSTGQKWDVGYEKTGYFLDWLERSYGDGEGNAIRKLNSSMKDTTYSEDIFVEITAENVGMLWSLYCAEVDRKDRL